MNILKKIGIFFDIIGFTVFLITSVVVKSLVKIDILYFSLMLIGVIFQIPSQVIFITKSERLDLLDKKYLFGLFLACIGFLFLLFFTIKEFYL